MPDYNVTLVGNLHYRITHCFLNQMHNIISAMSADCPDYRMKSITVHGKECPVVVQKHSNTCDDPKDLEWRPEYAHMKLSRTDTFLVLFSVKSRKEFEQTEKEWIPQIRSYFLDAPIIIVAIDIDARVSDQHLSTVSTAEVYNMAKKLGTSYFEISCKRYLNVNDCFHHAVELAMINKKKFKAANTLKRCVSLVRSSSAIIPPLRPPFEPEPIIKVLPSSFINDWTEILSNPKFHDIRLLVEEDRYFLAHRAILCSASSVFRTLLSTRSFSDTRGSFQKDNVIPHEIQGICKMYDSPDGGELTVEFSADIKAKTIDVLLEFMYTGFVSKDFKGAKAEDIKYVAKLFEFDELASYCDKVLACQDFQKNEHLKDFTDNQKEISMMELLNKGIFSDMDFILKGMKIPAHKVVLCTRSSGIAALIDSKSAETGSRLEIPISNTSVVCFKQFLEFLYTDQVQLVNTSSTVTGLLSLAHEYGVQRLISLCEMHLRAELEMMFSTLYCANAELINAIELLNRYKACHALQMVDWCRHYISYNFTKFGDTEEFQILDQEDQDYIKKHRWPPLSYIKEMDDFLTKHLL